MKVFEIFVDSPKKQEKLYWPITTEDEDGQFNIEIKAFHMGKIVPVLYISGKTEGSGEFQVISARLDADIWVPGDPAISLVLHGTTDQAAVSNKS